LDFNGCTGVESADVVPKNSMNKVQMSVHEEGTGNARFPGSFKLAPRREAAKVGLQQDHEAVLELREFFINVIHAPGKEA
jgi:hypothetical protein